MKPKHNCQFGKMCYRKNPVHFEEYSHPELEAIVIKGKNSRNEYDIPEDILAPRDDTKQQLLMIERVLKKIGSLPDNTNTTAATVNRQSPVPSGSRTPAASTTNSSSGNNTPKRPFPGASPTSTRADNLRNSSKPEKKDTKPFNGNVTIVLDSDDEEEDAQFKADMAQAIELSKRPKLDQKEIQAVPKPSSPAVKMERTAPKAPQPTQPAALATNKERIPQQTPKPVNPVLASSSDKSTPKTPSKPSNWLSAKKPTASSSSTPTTSRRPPPSASTSNASSSLSSNQQAPKTSKLEAKQKVSEGPRLVANDLSTVERKIEDYIDVVYPKGEAIKKFEASHPYNFFLTAIVDSPQTHSETLSITLQEILDSSLGDLESSVQINFMVDIGWLLAHYYFAGHNRKPILILYGDETPELQQIHTICPHVTAIKIQMTNPFSTHHTKMMLLGYKDKSMRVIISTANLYEDDWRNRTQGIWISPRCYEMDDQGPSSRGESVTGFRADLIRYLNKYSQPRLQEWTARILRTNFEAVKVFLIGSVPDSHPTLQNDPKWGHLRLGHLLQKHAAAVPDTCAVIAQSSSIGTLGRDAGQWVHEISTSLCRDSGPSRLKRPSAFKMIFPSYNNVLAGHDGLLSGGGLPYRREIHMKQRWLEGHLQLWRANQRHRTKALPHIKSYCRYSEQEGLYWFCLTSANLSKAAWGSMNKGLGQVLRISNYEMGVLFLPQIMLNKPTFCLTAGGADPPFPMPYDLPLVSYSIDDTPFFTDYLLNALK